MFEISCGISVNMIVECDECVLPQGKWDTTGLQEIIYQIKTYSVKRNVGEAGASCVQGQMFTKLLYENLAHMWSHH